MACARQSLWKAFFCIYDYFSEPTIVQLPHALKQQLLPFCNNHDLNPMLCWKDPTMIYCFHQDIPWVLSTSSWPLPLKWTPPSLLSLQCSLSLIPILVSGNYVVLSWSSPSQRTPFPKVVLGILQTPYLCQEASASHKQDPLLPLHGQTFLHVMPRKEGMTSCSYTFKNITLISTEQYWWYSSVPLLMPCKNLFWLKPWVSQTWHQEENTKFNKIFVVSFNSEMTQLSMGRNIL